MIRVLVYLVLAACFAVLIFARITSTGFANNVNCAAIGDPVAQSECIVAAKGKTE